jgi:hypothetical protein
MKFILLHRDNNSLAYGPFTQAEIDDVSSLENYRIILLNDGKKLMNDINKRTSTSVQKNCRICYKTFEQGYFLGNTQTNYCSRKCFENR